MTETSIRDTGDPVNTVLSHGYATLQLQHAIGALPHKNLVMGRLL